MNVVAHSPVLDGPPLNVLRFGNAGFAIEFPVLSGH